MADAREALVARQRDEYGASWDVLVPEVGCTLGRIIESVIEDALAEFDVTPRGERAKPSVEDVARVLFDAEYHDIDATERSIEWDILKGTYHARERGTIWHRMAGAVLALFERDSESKEEA